MINIFKTKSYKNKSVYKKNIGNSLTKYKLYPSIENLWQNNVYKYNINATKLTNVFNSNLFNLLKSYFYTYNIILEKQVKKLYKKYKLRRVSTNRIILSKPQIKYNNNSIDITCYSYNREKDALLEKINKQSLIYKLKKSTRKNNVKSIRYIKKLILIKSYKVSASLWLKINKQRNMLLVYINNNKSILDSTGKNVLFDLVDSNDNKYLDTYWKILVNNVLSKEINKSDIDKLLFVNKCKFETIYLLPFTHIINNTSNKKIGLNFINLKYYYLNSYILAKLFAIKLKNFKKKKNNLYSLMKFILDRFIIPGREILKPHSIKSEVNKKSDNIYIKNIVHNNDSLNYTYPDLNKTMDYLYTYNLKNLTDQVIDYIKYKSITGIRLKVSGRLTRRNTAARTIKKVKYKGNLKNFISSNEGIRTYMHIGYCKSNVQYTNIKSKRRIGSFGIKGWITSN